MRKKLTGIVCIALLLTTCSLGGDLEHLRPKKPGQEGGGGSIPVTAVTISPAVGITLSVGATQRLTATVLPANATDKTVTWTSDNPSIARVMNSDNIAIVTAVSVGEAKITATSFADPSKMAECVIKIIAGGGELSGLVSITGNPKAGEMLSATYTGTEMVSYQWQRSETPTGGNFIDIAGATAATYTLTTADELKYIRVTVSATGYNIKISNTIAVYTVQGNNLGKTWTAVTDPVFAGYDFIQSIAFGNGTFVAGSAGYSMPTQFAYSSDGKIWAAGGTSTFDQGQIRSIVHGNNMFVAVGTLADGSGSGISSHIAYSNDGITWTAVSGLTIDPGAWGFAGIAYGNDMFVAVNTGYQAIAYSADGNTWLVPNPSSEYIIYNSITFGDNKFIAGGCINMGKSIPYMAYSSNGIDWTTISIPLDEGAINGIAYGKDKFVAVGLDQVIDGTVIINTGIIMHSSDGTNWTAVNDPGLNLTTSEVQSIAFGDGVFVACGRGGKMAYSSDGITWTNVTNSTFSNNSIDSIYDITYGDGKFIAVGDNRQMAYSEK